MIMAESKRDFFQQLRKLAKTLDGVQSLVESAKGGTWCIPSNTSCGSTSRRRDTIARLKGICNELESLKEETIYQHRDIEQQGASVRGANHAVQELLNQQKQTLSEVEEYLVQYGYKTWENHKAELEEKVKSKKSKQKKQNTICEESQVTCGSLIANTIPDQVTSGDEKENENCDDDDDVIVMPRIEDFGLSSDFMNNYLTKSISKGNRQTPKQDLRTGLSEKKLQLENQHANRHTSGGASKQLFSTPSHLITPRQPCLSLKPSLTETNEAEDSPIHLPVPPVFLTPGLKTSRCKPIKEVSKPTVTQVPDDISGVIPIATVDISMSDIVCPTRPKFALSQNDLDAMRRQYDTTLIKAHHK